MVKEHLNIRKILLRKGIQDSMLEIGRMIYLMVLENIVMTWVLKIHISQSISYLLFSNILILMFRFNKGQLDKSSVTAYKNGMCGKVPLIGASPSVISSEVDKSANTNYGPQREMNAVEFRRLLSDSVTQPLWSRCVENRSMGQLTIYLLVL